MIKVICEWFIAGQLAMVPGIIIEGPVIRYDGPILAEMIKVVFKNEVVWMHRNSCFILKE